MSNQINDYAYGLAKELQAWDYEAILHLADALSHDLSTANAARDRFENLGLLDHIISCGTGEMPSVQEYEELRAERRDLGETWPSHSTLFHAYGSWTKAVRAAMRARFGNRMVPSDNKAAGFTPSYTPDEIDRAIRGCARSCGEEPSQWIYEEWATLGRRLARLHGQIPRLPGLKQIRRAYGSFDNALAAQK